MNNFNFGLARPVLYACFAMGIARCAMAQPSTALTPPPQPAPDPMTWQLLPVHNISPAMAAWLLDPQHNVGPAIPPDIQHAYDSGEEGLPGQIFRLPVRPAGFKATVRPEHKAEFNLPLGVESVRPEAQKHALLAFATTAGIERLQKILGYIDKPAPFVEIEAKIIEVGPENVAHFGIDFKSSNGAYSFKSAGTPSAGYSSNNWATQLDTLIAAHKAKILLDSHITTINNRTVSANSSYSCMETAAQGSYPEYVTVNDKLDMTPTVNNDNTITLVIGIKHTRLFYDDATGPGTQTSSTVTTTANIKDGDSIVMGGLKDTTHPAEAPGADTTNEQAHSADRELLVFVTACIVKPGQ